MYMYIGTAMRWYLSSIIQVKKLSEIFLAEMEFYKIDPWLLTARRRSNQVQVMLWYSMVGTLNWKKEKWDNEHFL
jgi:hypothetical protein